MLKFSRGVEELNEKDKVELVSKLEDGKLLELFESYSSNYNPIDEFICITYEVLKAEILKRMK